jgi:hypothetical protein
MPPLPDIPGHYHASAAGVGGGNHFLNKPISLMGERENLRFSKLFAFPYGSVNELRIGPTLRDFQRRQNQIP